MRISQERLDARVRVSEITTSIAKAMHPLPEGTTYAEVMLALANLQATWANNALLAELSNPDDAEEEKSDTSGNN